MTTYFSAKNLAFYNDKLRDGYYEKFDAWPEDAVEMTADEVAEYCGVTSPDGKVLSAKNGRPVWVDIPPRTREELIKDAENKRNLLLANADKIMIDWRTELMLGEISDDNRAKLSAWLAYKNQVKAVDVTTDPEHVSWPTAPEE